MVQKDLERAGVPYESHEGLADFHAAGRQSHITRLVRSGASIMEAKELARHADIRQTAKYTHIGMEDRAKALAGLPAPKSYAFVELSEIRRVSGGALSQELSPDDSDDDPDDDPGNEKTPSGEGVSSVPGVASQELAFDASYGGGGNCTRSPSDANTEFQCSYGDRRMGWPEHGREDESLRELVANWHRLTPSVREAIMILVRNSQP